MPLLGLEDYGSDDEEETPKVVPPKAAQPTTKRKPVKFTVDLPKPAEDDEAPRPAKRPRTTGNGKSVLLSMLPPPTKSTALPASNTSTEVHTKSTGEGSSSLAASSQDSSISLIPPSVQKGSAPSAGTSLSEDFFSLAPSKGKATSSSGRLIIPSISSAPTVTDYQPPEPTTEDEYPGYYKLPSGTWAQYDPEYYRSFWQKKKEEWEATYGGAAEKGFENAQEEAKEISVVDQLNHGQKLREERKNLTRNATAGPQKPNMNMEAPKGSRARYRHQLTALLSEAYEKREELEEKIAQARRNRKDAGNKYGF